MSNRKKIFKVVFHHQSKVYELYSKGVSQGSLYGFIEVEEFVFGERSKIVVDPTEEKLKSEFNGVTRSYIPLQAIIRIDEVDKEGSARISDAPASGGNIASFPFSGAPTGQKGSEE